MEDIDIAEMKKKWDSWYTTIGKDIIEKMKNWDSWDTTIGKDTVEKMKNWDTWESIGKDLKPYLAQVFDRMEAHDESIIQDFHFLKFIIIPKIDPGYYKLLQDCKDSIMDGENAHSAMVADIIKVLHNSDKLNDVLEAQTQLMNWEKEILREEWKKQHAVETKGDENSVVEDSNMGEYLKAKFTELGNLKANILNVNDKMQGLCHLRWDMQKLMNLLKVQKLMRSQEDLYKHEELIQNMLSAQDNSCSSTRAKKLRHASSEDNSVASSEDDICRQKRLKPDECL